MSINHILFDHKFFLSSLCKIVTLIVMDEEGETEREGKIKKQSENGREMALYSRGVYAYSTKNSMTMTIIYMHILILMCIIFITYGSNSNRNTHRSLIHIQTQNELHRVKMR